jgi:hypothetical protein
MFLFNTNSDVFLLFPGKQVDRKFWIWSWKLKVMCMVVIDLSLFAFKNTFMFFVFCGPTWKERNIMACYVTDNPRSRF